MANNHEQFIAFDDTIALSQTKEDELKKNRKALREKIRKYFKGNFFDGLGNASSQDKAKKQTKK